MPNGVGLTEFYTKSIPHSFDMWVKMVKKENLRKTFDEAIKVEKEMSSLGIDQEFGENKDPHPTKKDK